MPRSLVESRRAAPVLVFAYGSNLVTAQMVERCPSAALVARGRLRDHTLRFAGYSTRWDGAVADAAYARGRRLRGVVFLVGRADLARLDRHEGVPFAYERVTRSIHCDDGTPRVAQVYVQPTLGLEFGLPSAAYLWHVLAGYLDHRFDTRAILRALKESTSR